MLFGSFWLTSILCGMLNSVPTGHKWRGYRRVISLASFLIAAISAALAYSRFIEPRTLLIRTYDLALPGLPPALDGCRIAFVSDFHIRGPGDSLPAVNQVLTTLEQDRPDIILLGGDFYDKGVRKGEEPDWARFPNIAPTYAVPGNHDYKSCSEDADEIFATLREAGIDVMKDSYRRVELGGRAIDLIGVDDPYTNRDDFETAARPATSGANPRILLAHAGLIADYLPVGAADLMLSGHTHGAQIRISPFSGSGVLDVFWWLDRLKNKPISPYRQGMFWVRGTLLYVGNGVGMTSFGFRFMAPPELAFFRLRRRTGNQEFPCDSAEHYVLQSSHKRVWAPKSYGQRIPN